MMLLLVVAIITSPMVLFAALVSTMISAIVALVQVQIVGSLERDSSLTATCGHNDLAGSLTQAASFDLACNWTSGCTTKIVLATIFMINALIVPCSLHLNFCVLFACPQIGRVLIYNIAF